jgi:type I restriction enzyme, S subunit
MTAEGSEPLRSRWQYGRIVPMPEAVPPGWDFVRLTEVARLESGHTPSRKHPEYWSGNIPWVSLHDTKVLDRPDIQDTAQTIGELGLENSSARLLPPGTVVFSRTATVGKATILGREMATSQDFANYVCGPRLWNKYLVHLLRFLQPEWKRLMAGSTHNTIYMPVFESLQALLPPLGEQKKIAAILSSVDEAIEATQAVIDQLQVVKRAMMTEFLTKGLPGRHAHYKETAIGEVPEDWHVVSLGDLIKKGPDNGLYKPQSDYGTGTPIVRIDAFNNGDLLNGQGLRLVRVSDDEVARFRLNKNDILINRVNSLSHLAKTALVAEPLQDTVFESNMMRLAVDASRACPSFIFRVVASPASKEFFLSRAKQAVAQASVNQQDVRALPVPLPSQREQDEIARLFDSVDERLKAVGDTAAGLLAAKAALMSVLLTGEVRVKPDEDAA